MLAWGIYETLLRLHRKKVNKNLTARFRVRKKKKAVCRWCDPINATLVVLSSQRWEKILQMDKQQRERVRKKKKGGGGKHRRREASTDTVSRLVGLQPNFTASRVSGTAYGCNLCDSLCVSQHISADIPSQLPYWSNIMSNNSSAWVNLQHRRVLAPSREQRRTSVF